MSEILLSFRSRGIGADGGAPCFVCGGQEVFDNIAAFVQDKEGGKRVAGLFAMCGSHGRLDYRTSEPNWVQYKVLCCADHLPQLQRLHDLTSGDGMISPERLMEAMGA